MNRKGQIGQIFTSFPSLIFVFVIMLFFVIISGFIAKERSESYNLMEDFLDDYIDYNGEIGTIKELSEKNCKLGNFKYEGWDIETYKIDNSFMIRLVGHFNDNYDGNLMVVANYVKNPGVGKGREILYIEKEGYKPSYIVMDNFEDILLNSKQDKNVKSKTLCNKAFSNSYAGTYLVINDSTRLYE
ncbi:hypothetical protein FJZ21_02480 [Candidatus Pacearchaeota archaeon]|nr:hypothetical protein [Candidatus Pacearchaeota archaeon]